MVEVPEPGAGIAFGLKLTVAPVGTPEVDRFTVLLKPPMAVVVIVDVSWLLCPTLRDTGEAEILKIGDPVTVKVMTTVCWTLLPVAVTVMG
jgi:hypothetical protein